MSDNNFKKPIGREKELEYFEKAVSNAHSSKGTVICIAGESGFGKTYLLNYFYHSTRIDPDTISIQSSCTKPLGNFNIASLQPLNPFMKIIEYLLQRKDSPAVRRFAYNVGMTALSAIPFIGDVLFAVKEFGKDLRQYKKEKSEETALTTVSPVHDYFDTLCAFAEKKPLLIFIDDFNYADAQSIELLELIIENIKSIPIVLVFSTDSNLKANSNQIFFNLINSHKHNPDFKYLELSVFNSQQISDYCFQELGTYPNIDKIEKILFERSKGIPAFAAEYLVYLKKNRNTLSDTILEEFDKRNDFSAISLSFAKTLENLTQEEINILATCSCEGSEFTAYLISNLLNLDILTSIKKLKSIQSSSGLIKSIGPQTRYGLKTTVFCFTRAFYQKYFEETLEYEEKLSIHGLIASILKQKYEEANTSYEKQEIAPFFAAHSSQCEDNETARNVLLDVAREAARYESQDVIKDIYKQYVELMPADSASVLTDEEIPYEFNSIKNNLNNNNSKESVEQSVSEFSYEKNFDYKLFREYLVKKFHDKKYDIIQSETDKILSEERIFLVPNEKVEILCISCKAMIDNKNIELAMKYFEQAENIISEIDDKIIKCLFYNLGANIGNLNNNSSESQKYLKLAAEASSQAPIELQLLTTSNIALIDKNNSENISYKIAAKELAANLNFNEFIQDLTAV